MTLEEQIQEVSADMEEIKRAIDDTNRPRIKQNLELQKRKFEKELQQLQEKQQQEQKAAAEAEEKAANASALSTSSRPHTKDITVYAWDQSDKFVKIYVQNLNGVDKLSENQVQCTFETRAFQLQIQNLNNINYSLKRIGLLDDIDPDQSTFKVKKDMVILSLRKVESKNWECLLKDEKKAPTKPLPKPDKSKSPNESLLNMVEEIYHNGDDDTKRAITKAWIESREKANALGTQPPTDDKKFANVIKTSDFTIYPRQ